MKPYRVYSKFRDAKGKTLFECQTFGGAAANAKKALKEAWKEMARLGAEDARVDSIASTVKGPKEEISTTDYLDELGMGGASSSGLINEVDASLLDRRAQHPATGGIIGASDGDLFIQGPGTWEDIITEDKRVEEAPRVPQSAQPMWLTPPEVMAPPGSVLHDECELPKHRFDVAESCLGPGLIMDEADDVDPKVLHALGKLKIGKHDHRISRTWLNLYEQYKEDELRKSNLKCLGKWPDEKEKEKETK